MEYEKLTKKIIGCAFTVYNTMGFGFLESVYEKCMLVELAKSGITVAAQYPIKVHYEKAIVGEFVVDLLVEESVIVELKSVRRLNKAHEMQLVNYLVAMDKPVGLLINFGEKKVEVKRKIKTLEFRQD